MEAWLPTIRTLIAVGLALLLVMLRLEAVRFNAAEYDDPIDGRAPSLRRRVAWYAIGLVLVAAIFLVHPAPQADFALSAGDRQQALVYGFLYAAAGTAIALGIAFYRYRRLRFPDAWSYPGALLNAVVTALIDEVAFRGQRDPGDPVRADDPSGSAWTEPLDAGDGDPRRSRRRLGDRGDRGDRGGLHRPRRDAVRGLPLDRPCRPVPAPRP